MSVKWSNVALAAFLDQRFSQVDKAASRPTSNLRQGYREAAAVLAVFDPRQLRPFGSFEEQGGELGAFENLMEDCIVPYGRKSGETLWVLKLDVRREALRGLIQRSAAASALAANPERPKTGVQPYLEALLLSQTPDANSLNAEELGNYLQALEWLDGLMPSLPSVEPLRQMRARASLLLPFEHLLEKGFVGRASELDQLRNFVGVKPSTTLIGKITRVVMTFTDSTKKPPLVVWGPGGTGKSTLIAKFVHEHAVCENQMQFPYAYLDFDSGSVGLNRSAALLIQILAQLGVQYPEQAPRISRFRRRFDRFLSLPEESSPTASSRNSLKRKSSGGGGSSKGTSQFARLSRLESMMISQLAALISPMVASSASTPTKPFLVLLDTFENVQQYSQAKVRKIASYMQALVEELPTFRAVVSGRNKVPELLPVDGASPTDIPLGDLDDAATQAVLLQWGVESAKNRSAIRTIAGGNPLNLRLATQLSLLGKLDTSLSTRAMAFITRNAVPLGEVLIQGQLYDRVLGAIEDEDVRKLAHPGLALRYLTPEIILEVLSEPCELHISTLPEAERIFAMVGHYAQLVSPDGEGLRHRPDVRRVMLKSLDQDKPPLVRWINEKAVEFHSKKTPLMNRAEEIYHRLRLNQSRNEVEPRWQEGVEEWLRGCLGELSLQGQLYLVEKRVQSDVEEDAKASLQDFEWEMLTASKVRELLSSGLITDAEDMLNERPDSGSGLLALCRGQIAAMKRDWDAAQNYLDEAQRSAISVDRHEDLECALLLGSNAAFQRGDFDTANRLAVRAEDVLSSGTRTDRLAWSVVMQFRAQTALNKDTQQLSEKLRNLSSALLQTGGATSGITQPLARQIAASATTKEELSLVFHWAMQPPISSILLKALFDAFATSEQPLADVPKIVSLTMESLSSTVFSQGLPETMLANFERAFVELLGSNTVDMAQIRSAFAQSSEVPTFGVGNA
jgi:cellulose synthase operon protein C